MLTDYEKLSLQVKLCELSLIQVGLELQHNGHLHMETEAVLECTQENIMLLSVEIMRVAKNAQTK